MEHVTVIASTRQTRKTIGCDYPALLIALELWIKHIKYCTMEYENLLVHLVVAGFVYTYVEMVLVLSGFAGIFRSCLHGSVKIPIIFQ